MSTVYSEKNKSLLDKTSFFMGYLPAGYPDRQKFTSLLESCCKLGMDVAEVGFPSKNPFADGDVIRHAHKAIDCTVSADIDYWRAIRASCPNPLWIMGYFADLVESGAYRKLAEENLVDAFVIPDCDDCSYRRIQKELTPYGVDMVRLVRPNSDEKVIREYFQSSAFIYYQLFNGLTGGSQAMEDFSQVLSIAREYGHIRILAGFGVNTPKQARLLLDAGFDGITIGTAMVRELNASAENLLEFVGQIVREIKG